MARKRDISPERWTKDDHLALSWGADHFLVGLLNFTDDEGRVEWSPRQLWSRVSPRPDVSIDQVEGWMNEIVANGLYATYVVRGKPYAQAGEWWAEQYIAKPQPSTLPGPEAGEFHTSAEHSGMVWNGMERSSLARVPDSVTVTDSDSVTDPEPVACAREETPPKPSLVTAAVEVWNEERAETQPAVRRCPGDVASWLREFLAELDNDLNLWRRAVRAFASDAFMNGTDEHASKARGIDTMLRRNNRAKWLIAAQSETPTPVKQSQRMTSGQRLDEAEHKLLDTWRERGWMQDDGPTIVPFGALA